MLHILHINDTDTHQPAGWAPAAATIRHLRQRGQCDLLLHAGDLTLGGESGDHLVGLLNDLGFDAITPGNHEFDRGLAVLRRQLAAFSGAVLCANASGFTQSMTIERRGMRIALTGVLLPELNLLQPPRNLEGMELTAPETALRSLVPELRRQADMVVVISHCGLDADRELARAVPGIDLIVGGHSHHLLTAPVREGATLIVQAGAFGEYVGCVSVDASGQLGAQVIPTAPADPPPVSTSTSPIGYTETDLRTDDYARETPLGNLTADLMRQAAGTDFALLRCSSVRNAYPPGPLTADDVRGMNFCGIDSVVRLELTG
ncbi:MAG TPA: metallophosphoesterase, partial [Symbiobacteriaceae bacterium]|nr:metallophosphoesterase [Symbiobacteriaceae bacterium]